MSEAVNHANREARVRPLALLSSRQVIRAFGLDVKARLGLTKVDVDDQLAMDRMPRNVRLAMGMAKRLESRK